MYSSYIVAFILAQRSHEIATFSAGETTPHRKNWSMRCVVCAWRFKLSNRSGHLEHHYSSLIPHDTVPSVIVVKHSSNISGTEVVGSPVEHVKTIFLLWFRFTADHHPPHVRGGWAVARDWWYHLLVQENNQWHCQWLHPTCSSFTKLP